MTDRQVLIKPSKIQVAIALALKPDYWPDLWRRVKLNVGQALLPPPMGQGRDVASAWAEDVKVEATEALERLGISIVTPFSEANPELVAEAERLERESPEKLGGGGGVDMIWQVCEGLQARTVVETGVAYGWSSLAILASLQRRGGELFSVDMPHPLLKDQGLTGIVVPDHLRFDWTLIREPDHSGLKKVLDRARDIDFVHYDSDKSYTGRCATYRRLWACLRAGGVFMSDDIGDNTAFRDFAAEMGEEPIVVLSPGSGSAGNRYVGLLRKR